MGSAGRAQTQTKIVSERNNIILGSFTSSYPRNNIPLRMCREWNLFGGLIGLLKCSYLYGLSQHLHVAWTRMLRISSKSSSLFFSICLHRHFLCFDFRHIFSYLLLFLWKIVKLLKFVHFIYWASKSNSIQIDPPNMHSNISRSPNRFALRTHYFCHEKMQEFVFALVSILAPYLHPFTTRWETNPRWNMLSLFLSP